MSKFFNPVKCDNSFLLIKYYARVGVEEILEEEPKEGQISLFEMMI